METVPAQLIKDLVLLSIAISGVVALVVGAVRANRTQKRELQQPVEVEMRDKNMTHGEHKAVCGALHERVGTLEGRMRRIEDRMDQDKQQIIASGEERAVEMHRRIDGIPAQVIALLKDTKGLL